MEKERNPFSFLPTREGHGKEQYRERLVFSSPPSSSACSSYLLSFSLFLCSRTTSLYTSFLFPFFPSGHGCYGITRKLRTGRDGIRRNYIYQGSVDFFLKKNLKKTTQGGDRLEWNVRIL
jgi:hypothetical protein